MSHVATVETKIADLDTFEEAVVKLGGELRRGQQTFRSYQPNRVCDHAVRLRDVESYEVGLTPRVDGEGGWNLAYDSWGIGAKLEQAFGRNLETLRNEYTALVAEQHLARRGYRVQREVDTRQQIQLRAIG